jgi:hypothetical protein
MAGLPERVDLPQSFTVNTSQLSVSTGADGSGEASLMLTDNLAVAGSVQLAIVAGEVSLTFGDPELRFTPGSPSPGIPAASFAVRINRLPEQALIAAVFGMDGLGGIASLSDGIAAAGDWQRPVSVTDFWVALQVIHDGYGPGDLGEVAVGFTVESGRVAEASGQGRALVAGKLTDDGVMFLRTASCSPAEETDLCVAEFTGEAAGLSSFFLAALTPIAPGGPGQSAPSPEPEVDESPTPTPAPTPRATPTRPPVSTPAPSPRPVATSTATTGPYASPAPLASTLPLDTAVAGSGPGTDGAPAAGGLPAWVWAAWGVVSVAVLGGIFSIARRRGR